jgi:acetyl-CoA carboxylase biotin carboxyl carrier protein
MASKQKKAPAPETKPADGQAQSSLDVDTLRQVMEVVETSEVTRLEWRRGDERLLIVRGHPPAQQAPVVFAAPAAPAVSVAAAPMPVEAPVAKAPAAAPAPAAAAAPAAKPGTVVTSPFVGTFYRTPAPDQAPFVDIGSTVKKGQVLCIVEAMKLMNEIEAEVAGKVVEILVQNGQPVEFGQPLFRIET